MINFYGPGFKNLGNALAAYRPLAQYRRYALAINPGNSKWYVVTVS
jgi:hypothetical protein